MAPAVYRPEQAMDGWSRCSPFFGKRSDEVALFEKNNQEGHHVHRPLIEVVRAAGMGERGDEWFPLSQAVVAYDHARHAPLGDVITLDLINMDLEPGARAGIELTNGQQQGVRVLLDRAICGCRFEEPGGERQGAGPSLVRAALTREIGRSGIKCPRYDAAMDGSDAASRLIIVCGLPGSGKTSSQGAGDRAWRGAAVGRRVDGCAGAEFVG